MRSTGIYLYEAIKFVNRLVFPTGDTMIYNLFCIFFLFIFFFDNKRYLRCISNFHPLSKPESGINGCSPRQDKYLPLSSIVGVNFNMEIVVLPSALACKRIIIVVEGLKMWMSFHIKYDIHVMMTYTHSIHRIIFIYNKFMASTLFFSFPSIFYFIFFYFHILWLCKINMKCLFCQLDLQMEICLLKLTVSVEFLIRMLPFHHVIVGATNVL